MTRWMLDIVRLIVFCGLFLFAATTLIAGEDDVETTSKSFGLSIQIEDGEIKVEQTGDADFGELSELLEGKIGEIVQRISENGDLQVRAKALFEDGGEIVKDLPIRDILNSIKNEIHVSGDVKADVDVEVENDKDGRHRVEILSVADGGEDDVMQIIKGLKSKLSDRGVKRLRWTADDGGDGEMLFVPTDLVGRHGTKRATHRLGIQIGGTAGVVVDGVTEGSAAAAAGFEEGDILLSVDGETVDDVGTLIVKVNESGQSGESMTIKVVRSGKMMTISATPAKVDDSDSDEHEDDDDLDRHSEHDHHSDIKIRVRRHAEEAAEHAREAMEHAKDHAEKHMEQVRLEVKRARKMEKETIDRARSSAREARESDKSRRDRTEMLEELQREVKELREMVEELHEEIDED